MNVLLEVKGLSVAYRKVQALNGMDLAVQAGQVVTVIGPNGAGKSTLLNALIGVLPSAGMLRFEGQDITRLSVEERVELGMCLVPEKRELFTEMSVEDNLYMGAFSRTRRKMDMDSDLQAIYIRFPRLLERRAPDAGLGTRADGQAALAHAGRAQFGLGPIDGPGDVSDHFRFAPKRCLDALDRAKRPGCIEGGRSWPCAGNGRSGFIGHSQRAAPKRAGSGDLFGHGCHAGLMVQRMGEPSKRRTGGPLSSNSLPSGSRK